MHAGAQGPDPSLSRALSKICWGALQVHHVHCQINRHASAFAAHIRISCGVVQVYHIKKQKTMLYFNANINKSSIQILHKDNKNILF